MAIEIPGNNSPDSCFESLWLHCLDRIGRGSNRDVYAIPEHGDKVLKVSNRQANFSNWAEVLIHHHKKDYGDLAEIISWSWSGKFIVMERLNPLQPGELVGYTFPEYLTDRKPENYGRDSSGKIKALDYASLKLDSGYVSAFK
jgi:hypothetical protein